MMNRMQLPLISIIVAVHNGKATLQQCIDSVVQQSYANKELIIIDGGSRDGTMDLIEANKANIAYWVSEPDRGIYGAWNKGLAQANGEWICFLGADDYFWDREVLKRMADRLSAVPENIRVAYARIMRLDVNGQELGLEGEPWELAKNDIGEFLCIPHPGTMHRRSLFVEHGNFDESFSIAGDYEFLLRELISADAIHFPDIVSTGVRTGGISNVLGNTIRSLRERRRAQRMHGRTFPSRLWLNMMAKEYVRLLLWKIVGERLARRILDLRRRMHGLPPFWTNS